MKNFKETTSKLKKIGAKRIAILKQIDTYYNCKAARLKIREINNKRFELIYYQRPKKVGAKLCDYYIAAILKKNLQPLKFILKETCGERVIVRKERELWLYKHTRIHLDKVEKLGNFLELETVIKNLSEARAMKECSEVIDLLGLNRYKKIKYSYSELLLDKI